MYSSMYCQSISEGVSEKMCQQQYDLFVGCYGAKTDETIHWLNFDARYGKLRIINSFKGIENPSFLAVNKKKSHLYAISEKTNGEVVSFQWCERLGTLKEVKRQPTNGGPCYLEHDEHALFTANYGNGSVIVHSLKETGEIGNEIDFYQTNSPQQSDSKVHAIRNIPNTPYYLATDLGLNKLNFFKHNHSTGELTFLFDEQVPDGSGPRHVAFHPTLRVFYIVNEFNSTVLTYMYDENLQQMELLQTLPTIYDNFQHANYGADIHITRSGKFVYTSNRGHDSITAYKVLNDGTLAFISHTKTEGQWPRNFIIMPNDIYVLVANEQSNNIMVFEILEDGSLQRTGHRFHVNRPVCLHVVE